jgi:hypothetical protein
MRTSSCAAAAGMRLQTMHDAVCVTMIDDDATGRCTACEQGSMRVWSAAQSERRVLRGDVSGSSRRRLGGGRARGGGSALGGGGAASGGAFEGAAVSRGARRGAGTRGRAGGGGGAAAPSLTLPPQLRSPLRLRPPRAPTLRGLAAPPSARPPLAAPRRRTYARYLFTAQPTPRQIQARYAPGKQTTQKALGCGAYLSLPGSAPSPSCGGCARAAPGRTAPTPARRESASAPALSSAMRRVRHCMLCRMGESHFFARLRGPTRLDFAPQLTHVPLRAGCGGCGPRGLRAWRLLLRHTRLACPCCVSPRRRVCISPRPLAPRCWRRCGRDHGHAARGCHQRFAPRASERRSGRCRKAHASRNAATATALRQRATAGHRGRRARAAARAGAGGGARSGCGGRGGAAA